MLAGPDRPTRLLAYRRPWSDPEQEPRTSQLDALVLYLGPGAPDGRWVAVCGESRLDGRSSGLLDRRSGRVHWIDGTVRVQGWTDGR